MFFAALSAGWGGFFVGSRAMPLSSDIPPNIRLELRGGSLNSTFPSSRMAGEALSRHCSVSFQAKLEAVPRHQTKMLGGVVPCAQ